MNENRNAQFPGQPPGNFGMMSSHPGFVQPGMTGFPMMQQQGMMGPQTPMMQQQVMMANRVPMIQGNRFPMQMGMRPVPPQYNQALTDSYRQRGPTPTRGSTPPRNRAPLSPESQRRALEQEKRARQFQEQQQRLKNFSKGGSKVDADSLIESMFGKSEKPTPKHTSVPPAAKATTETKQIDDGFGDFLGGPSTPAGQEGSHGNQNVNNSEATPTTNEQISTPSTENIPPKEEKKDLMAMMFECSDLSAPNKAKTFHKPSLKELPPSHHQHHTFQQSRLAHQWKQEENLDGLFLVQEPAPVSAPPTSPQAPPQTIQAPPTLVKFEVPAWCHEDDKVPHLYRQVLEAATVDGKISTDRLYPILVLSGLPKETLGQIWSLANQSTPGQLIKPELYLILALIAFAQNNITSLSPEMLRKCPQPPVPFLGQQAPPPPQPVSTSELPPQNNATVENSGISGTLPTIQGSQTSHTAGNSGTVGTLPTVTDSQTLMATGNPAVLGNQPVPSQGVPGVGLPGFSGLGGSQAGKTEDDDFADFQEAPTLTSTAIASSPKKSNKLKKEPEYLYSVPKPEDLQIQMSPDMNHSNISNFFGSDDSSVSASPQRKIVTGKKGASTPNSLDDDFDDFKSADSKPSDSSQFTSSEQSENEDFKVLESYLDDFNKKKSEQEKQQESPLHRPLPKFTSPQSSQLPSNATLSAIPAARNLWSKPPAVKKETAKAQPDLPRAHLGLSPPESSDSEFADFQAAPCEQTPAPTQGVDLLKASQSDTCLIGDEDKYAALRAFEVNEDTTVTVAPSIFDSKPAVESEEDSWADFQAVSTDAKIDEIKQINDQSDVLQTNFTSNTQNDWSSFSSSANVTSKEDSDWSAFGNGTEATNIPKDDWSSFSQGEVVKDQQKDDWSNFSQGVITKDENKDEWASFHSSTGSNDTIENANQTPQLVEVKKQHLQTKDILGLFKVKENPVSVVSRDDFVETEREKTPPAQTNIPLQKSKKLSSDSDMDDDHFRAPPPMDYVDEEDDAFGDFSRGYDLDEVVNKPATQDEKKKNLYNFYGMEAPPSKSISQGSNNKAQTSMLDPTETDSSSVSGNVSGFPSNPAISEDSMSTSSLELPGLKGRVPVVRDMDSQSISSNEFGTFETHQKKNFNPESKSLDSLDLKKEEVESVENLEMPENEVKDESEHEQKENFSQFSEPVLPFASKVPEPLPVLGDRYSCLMEDIPGSDKHVHEWQKCLESCYKVIKDANAVFNSISSSAVCNEVIMSEQGSEFVKGVVEIYRVVCKINVSIESTGLTNEKLKQLLKDIDLVWNNLAAFLVGGNLMPEDKELDFKNGILKSDDQAAQFRACGVCLLDVDAACKDFGGEVQCAKLTYGGRQYHAMCANLWVNLVDSMLPALKLPELL